jgi:HD-like signal output (HDOD) protein
MPMKLFNDFTEGAGLGIALAVITLKSIGIDTENFTFGTDKNDTVVRLFIPRHIKPKSFTDSFKKHLVDDIEILPFVSSEFEKNGEKLINSCGSVEELVKLVLLEPSILLELYSKCFTIEQCTVDTVSEIIQSIGLDAAKNSVKEVLSRSVGSDRHSEYNGLIEHSRRTVQFALYINDALSINYNSEKLTIASLLHDFGKIILFTAGNNFSLRIARKLHDKRLETLSYIDETTTGTSHIEVGALFGKKWHLPDYAQIAIINHHYPDIKSDIKTDSQKIVYVANLFAMFEMKLASYYDFEEHILEELGILDRKKFNTFYKEMQTECVNKNKTGVY